MKISSSLLACRGAFEPGLLFQNLVEFFLCRVDKLVIRDAKAGANVSDAQRIYESGHLTANESGKGLDAQAERSLGDVHKHFVIQFLDKVNVRVETGV